MSDVIAAVVDRGEGYPTARELRRRAFEYLNAQAIGGKISYSTLTDVLGGVESNGRRGRAAILAAGRDLLNHPRPRLLVNIRSYGYQVALSNMQAGEGRRRHSNANRALARAHAIVSRVIYDALTDSERTELLEQQTRIGLSLIASRKLSRPQTAIPAAVKLSVPSGRQLVALLTKPAKA